jgi:hypothetical protein
VLGLDAFQTGKHLLPVSVAMLVFALLRQRTAARRSPHRRAARARTGAGMSAAPTRIRASAAMRALTARASLPSRSLKAGSGIVAARDYDRL